MILLVVDVQKGIMNSRLYEFEKVRNNIKQLISCARENDVEVVYVKHDDGPNSGFSKGDISFEIYEEITPLTGEKIFEKNVNSCFNRDTGLVEYLNKLQETHIMIVGLQTDFCIDATVKTGCNMGYDIIIPAYTNSTFDNEYFSAEKTYTFYNNFMWPNRYARCISMDDAISLLKVN